MQQSMAQISGLYIGKYATKHGTDFWAIHYMYSKHATKHGADFWAIISKHATKHGADFWAIHQ
jgi:hypothetical protein